MDATRKLLEFIFSVIAFTVASPDAVLFDGADPGELLCAPFVGKWCSVFLDARNVGVHAPMLDAYTEFVIDAPSSVLQVLWDFPAHFLNLLLGSPTRVGIASHHAVDICVEEIASAVLGTGNRVMRWERGGLYPRFLPLVTAFLHVLQNAHGDFLALLVDAGEFSHCHLSSPSSRFDPENLSIERALASGS